MTGESDDWSVTDQDQKYFPLEGNTGQLSRITKEFLLSILKQSQADKRWEWRKISIKEFLVDPKFPELPS